MKRAVRLSIAVAVTCVTATACSSPSKTPVEAGTHPEAAASTPSIPVGSAFGAPAWGAHLAGVDESDRPIVTAERVIVLQGDRVRALDATGQEAWTGTWDAIATDARANDELALPLLRQVSPDLVAVVDGGRVKGEGLDAATYDVHVRLFNIKDGSVVKDVTLPGTANQMPRLGKVGLGFLLTDGLSQSAQAVLPTGDITKISAADGQSLAGAATIGSTALTITGEEPEVPDGFSGPGYDSISLAPSRAYSLASIQASNAENWALGRFAVPNGAVAFRLFAADSGQVLSEPACDPISASKIVMSPNRQWGVLGRMRVGGQGQAQCFGGEGQKDVNLTAVTDEGRAFGMASESLEDPLLLEVSPSGEVKTIGLPEGASPPIGVMNGDLAIHWAAQSGVLSANPIK